MRIVTHEREKLNESTVIALGTFDGMHRGHRAVIFSAVQTALKDGLKSCVWTFSAPPKNGAAPIDTREQRLEKFEKAGLDIAVMPELTPELMATEPEVFFEKYLVENCGARHLVCGFNYTFGARARGDVGLLRKLCEKRGVGLTVLDPVTFEGKTVSSTLIREAIKKGDSALVTRLLGRAPERLETPRLILRKAKRDDLENIWKNVWSDESIAQSMLWRPTLTRDEAEARMERTLLYQASGHAYFVCLKDTGEAVGFAGVKETGDGEYDESGICVASRLQGMGLGKEILEALCALVFDILGGRVFRYTCFRDNARSAALCRALGFKYLRSEPGVRAWDGYEYVSDIYVKNREDR